MYAPAEPVKKTFRPAFTMSSTACCSGDNTISGVRVIFFKASATASDVASGSTSLAGRVDVLSAVE